ncbi:MAG: diguanylate cyclase [Firmicutes bacterium]|nr:diguanylate cyclase [Bacillota bacterium]
MLNKKGILASACRNHTVIVSKSGEELDIVEQVTPLLDNDNQLLAVLVVFRELTNLEAQQMRIAQLTYRDSLTGLFNRVFFDQELPRLDNPAYWPLSVIFADLNGLKLTNDIFGHSMGDALLLEVAQVFREIFRPEDRVCRWGGDEFIVLMPRTDAVTGNEIRQRLQEELESRVVGTMKLNVPIGLSTKEHASQDIRKVVQQAEEEMYWRKAISRGNYQSETLQSIISELHSKSEGEREHAERVQALATEFGEFLGLAPHEMRKLQHAAMLHDIGKVVLEPELLRKPFPLEPAEDHEMKRHPLVGFRLLNFFEDTMELASAVLAHHEHWDGNGYPKGLKGEEIPVLGRILAIVETYDRALYEAVSEDFSSRQALDIIVQGSGKKFDPHLASAFVDMMEAKMKE